MSSADRRVRFPMGFIRRKHVLACVNTTFICFVAAGLPAAAQMRGTVIEGATVIVGDGRVLPGATVVMQGGKIATVGNDVEAPAPAEKIAAPGKYVTPGLIDVWSTLALDVNAIARRADAKAADAFNRYAKDDIEDALRQGVTALYVPARAGSGVGGYGAVVRLYPGVAAEEFVLDDEVALCASLGVNASEQPFARVKAAAALRKAWQDARDYRRAWEDYEEDLKEYEKKLKERAKKAKEEKKGKKQDDKKEEGKKRGGQRGGAAVASQDQKKASAKKDEKKKDELKKPSQPAKDRSKEVLLRVLDGEMALRVEAHRPEDILNILDVAQEFDIALILEGGTGAHHVAERLAEMDVPVVLGAAAPPLEFSGGYSRYHSAAAAVKLAEAG
ncbi:MAG: hypothetical protein JSV72_19440, partial [Ralstonia sp.]